MDTSSQATQAGKPMDATSRATEDAREAAERAAPRMQQLTLPFAYDVHVSTPVVEGGDVAWPGPQTVRQVQSRLNFKR
jgi:hypothetical protein